MMDSDDEDGEHDAYLERMKAEKKDRDSDDLNDDSDSSGNFFLILWFPLPSVYTYRKVR